MRCGFAAPSSRMTSQIAANKPSTLITTQNCSINFNVFLNNAENGGWDVRMSTANGFHQAAKIGTDGFQKVWRLAHNAASSPLSTHLSLNVTDDQDLI